MIYIYTCRFPINVDVFPYPSTNFPRPEPVSAQAIAWRSWLLDWSWCQRMWENPAVERRGSTVRCSLDHVLIETLWNFRLHNLESSIISWMNIDKYRNDTLYIYTLYHRVIIWFWLVVWNIFYFSRYWEFPSSQLTNIFQRGFKPPTRIICI